jgi:hypothetical protein
MAPHSLFTTIYIQRPPCLLQPIGQVIRLASLISSNIVHKFCPSILLVILTAYSTTRRRILGTAKSEVRGRAGWCKCATGANLISRCQPSSTHIFWNRDTSTCHSGSMSNGIHSCTVIPSTRRPTLSSSQPQPVNRQSSGIDAMEEVRHDRDTPGEDRNQVLP